MDLTEIELSDGTVRRLGNNPPPAGLVKGYAAYPTANLVPRADWPGLIAALGNTLDTVWLPPVHDQDGIGMCNCSATAGAGESQRAKQGLPYVKLSAGDLYHRISGGRDDGSTLEDGVHAATAEGIASVAVVPYLDWRTTHGAAAADRGRFKFLEVFLCPTFDHCASAVLEGFDLISGILWYDNYTPDSDGWLPRPRGRSGGHAIHGYKLVSRGSEFGIAHQNSWGPNWGVGGKFVIPESAYSGDVGGWWAVRSMTDEGGTVPAPKF